MDSSRSNSCQGVGSGSDNISISEYRQTDKRKSYKRNVPKKIDSLIED